MQAINNESVSDVCIIDSIDTVGDLGNENNVIPLIKHPKFSENYEEFREKILSFGWIAYNEKTIDIESKIISPVCTDLIYQRLPGSNKDAIRWIASETLVDESYHVLMVVNALRVCKNVRGLENINLGNFELTHKMNMEMDLVDEAWKRQLIQLTTSIVSEVFISDYLSQISNSSGIQPLNRLVTTAHREDEMAHSGIFKILAKEIYHSLNNKQQEFFVTHLAKPVKWFASKELSVWHKILQHLHFPHANEIINDCRSEGESDLSRIDYSELIALSEEAGILDTLVGRETFMEEGII